MVRELLYRFKLLLWLVLFAGPVLIAEINLRYTEDEHVRIIYPSPPNGLLNNASVPPQELADAGR